MKIISVGLIFLLVLVQETFAQTPVSHPDFKWEKVEELSDEFDALDLQKWTNDPNDWGIWSWEPELAYVEGGDLKIKMIQDTHTRNNSEFYYKSGIIRNHETITYGYFETRMKGSERFPGACPAFWLYSINQPNPTEEGQSKYCEIDVVELTQREWNFDTNDWEGPEAIDMNLHAVVLKNGELAQIRPRSSPEIAKTKWYADFDPRDDYHTYGVLSRADSIFWYIDGIERGRKENLYWHLPMHITVSMGLRSPFERYDENGQRQPVPEATTTEGFPTHMHCDYVRVWEAAPQIISNPSQYETLSGALNFDCYFDAGSGFIASSGLNVRLQEMNENGQLVKEYTQTDNSIIGRAAGKLVVNMDISEVPFTSSLPNGNYYQIVASFISSKDGGITVNLSNQIVGIEVEELAITSTDHSSLGKIELFPNPAKDEIKILGIEEKCQMIIFDVHGKVHLRKQLTKDESIGISQLPIGVYCLKLESAQGERTLRFLKN
ncbi:family 16 glycosylhydrolase [Sediminitomix flava]|uniref:Putative secreted protein (Por secretion system target) n=1 Tax=Sediminitomix flava TaxID=379075 RepID=A0A315ZAC9_SEDFL|nr:family 16 glycosylhydrolase [Sediminitomix flava]PWJ41798.1 putative secreted protein (Por secretion system target) [Sediminitomix flava]